MEFEMKFHHSNWSNALQGLFLAPGTSSTCLFLHKLKRIILSHSPPPGSRRKCCPYGTKHNRS